MPKYVALLRAINVGGHVVKMDQLRELFEALEFAEVSTFIASGNVIFDAPTRDIAALAERIESHLKDSLGYDVVTLIRTPKQLHKIVDMQPYPAAVVNEPDVALYVGFLATAPTAAARDKLMAFNSPESELRLREREVYWLLHRKISDSIFSAAKMERVLGQPMTMRNITTVRKLVALTTADTGVVAKKKAK